jgi:hypothetical protein
MRLGSWILLVGAGLGLPGTVRAQADAQQACRQVYVTMTAMPLLEGDTCQQLATVVVSRITERVNTGRLDTLLPAGALQSRRVGAASPAGSPAQGEAVPGVQPTSLAAASLGVAGTDAGTEALTSVSLNPALLFGSSDAASMAKWGRFADVTVYFPVTDAGVTTQGELDYFGLRARINLTGLSQGGALYQEALGAFRTTLGNEGRLVGRLTAALRSAPDVGACVKAVGAASFRDRVPACGGDFSIELSEDDYDALRDALSAAREKADARFFGLDLRFETGDPTLGSTPGAEVTALQAGLAIGRRFRQPSPTATCVAFRSRLGMRFTDPKGSGADATWAADGGLGLDVSRMLNPDQFVTLTGGFEFRYSDSEPSERAALQTDVLAFRGSLTVPLVGSSALTVGFGTAVAGEMDTNLTFLMNWGLMLPGMGALRGGGR